MTTREQLVEAAECAYWRERFREMPNAEIYDVRVEATARELICRRFLTVLLSPIRATISRLTACGEMTGKPL
jgi:hypothetical protein